MGHGSVSVGAATPAGSESREKYRRSHDRATNQGSLDAAVAPSASRKLLPEHVSRVTLDWISRFGRYLGEVCATVDQQ